MFYDENETINEHVDFLHNLIKSKNKWELLWEGEGSTGDTITLKENVGDLEDYDFLAATAISINGVVHEGAFIAPVPQFSSNICLTKTLAYTSESTSNPVRLQVHSINLQFVEYKKWEIYQILYGYLYDIASMNTTTMLHQLFGYK